MQTTPHLPPQASFGVRDTGTVCDSPGSILKRDDALLLDLAVFGPRMDAVDHIAAALLHELSLEDPGVHVDPNLGHCVGAVWPTIRLPTS